MNSERLEFLAIAWCQGSMGRGDRKEVETALRQNPDFLNWTLRLKAEMDGNFEDQRPRFEPSGSGMKNMEVRLGWLRTKPVQIKLGLAVAATILLVLASAGLLLKTKQQTKVQDQPEHSVPIEMSLDNPTHRA